MRLHEKQPCTGADCTVADCENRVAIAALSINDFLRDIEEVCKRYNISIGHEDGHGCFLILDYDDPRGYFGEGSFYDERKKVR